MGKIIIVGKKGGDRIKYAVLDVESNLWPGSFFHQSLNLVGNRLKRFPKVVNAGSIVMTA